MKIRFAGIVARVLWYGLAIYVGLHYLVERILPAVESAPDTVARATVAREIVGLVVLLAVFGLADLAIRRCLKVFRDRPTPPPQNGSEPHRYAFPDGVTVVVGSWLGLFAIASIVGLLKDAVRPFLQVGGPS